MENKKLTIEVGRIINGANVTLKKEITADEDIQPSIAELCAALQTAMGSEIPQTASIAQEVQLPHGLTPTPQMDSTLSELPILENPPHTYKPGDAVIEVLSPQKSNWSRQPRTVKEIQTRLIELGLRGVSEIRTFDGVMRRLLKQGRVRREKVNDTYKYYLK